MPDESAELLLGVLSENRLYSPIHEIKIDVDDEDRVGNSLLQIRS